MNSYWARTGITGVVVAV